MAHHCKVLWVEREIAHRRYRAFVERPSVGHCYAPADPPRRWSDANDDLNRRLNEIVATMEAGGLTRWQNDQSSS